MERWMLAFLAGHVAALFSPVLLNMDFIVAIVCICLAFLMIIKTQLTQPAPVKKFVYPIIFGGLFGVSYLMFMANLHFSPKFVSTEPKVFKVQGLVESVIVKPLSTHSQMFTLKAELIDGESASNYLSPVHLRLSWYKPKLLLQQGDRLTATVKLSKPHGYQNRFGFDYNQWLFSKKVIATGTIKQLTSYQHNVPNGSNLNQQQAVNNLYQATTGLPSQAIILAVGLGYRGLIKPDQFELYNHMGISHLLAISGLHIGIIYLVIMGLLKTITKLGVFRLNQQWLSASCIILLWCYIALINFPISATRAGLCVSIWVFLDLNYKHINKFKLLLIVAFISVLFEPFAPLSAAWWLTFSAVSGIILFIQKVPVPKAIHQMNNTKYTEQTSDRALKAKLESIELANIVLENKDESDGKRQVIQSKTQALINSIRLYIFNLNYKIRYLIKFQFFITFWIMPVVIFWFGGASLSSLLTNLIAIPVFSLVVVPAIFIGTLGAMLHIEFLTYALPLADVILSRLLALFSDHKLFHYWVDIPNQFWFGFVLLLISALIWPSFLSTFERWRKTKQADKHNLRLWFASGLVLAPVLLSLLPWQDSTSQWLKPRLKAHILDVGQGTSVLLQQGHSAFIYDLGPIYPSGFNATQAVIKPQLTGLGVLKVDRIIISHNDSDHLGDPSALGDLPWFNARKVTCVPSKWPWRNSEFQVIWPLQLPKSDFEALSKNDRSCVVKVTDKTTGLSMLLTGDITQKVERKLVALAHKNVINLQADLLVSGHHGSKYSSSLPFIKSVSPRWVFHSAGVNNRFGFPTKEVIERFLWLGTNTQYSTNQLGMIEVIFDQNLNRSLVGSNVGHNQLITVNGYLSSWQPFWKKQNPFRFSSEIR